MKCAMKKNNLFLSIATTVMLALTTACVEYPDVYGFAAAFGSSNQIWRIEYTPTQYTVQLESSTTTIFDEGAGISEYGFHIEVQENGYKPLEDIKATPTKNADGSITLRAPFQGEYGKLYSFYPYATDGQQTQKGATSTFKYTQSDFSPSKASSKLSFDENGQIVAVANYDRTSGHPITEATVSYGGLDLPTTITNNGSTVTAVLDLSRLEKGESYKSFVISAKNDMGVTNSQTSFSVTVPNTSTESYPDDGEKEDCIRLCGIDWAKGNLANDGDKYYIEENQWEAGGDYSARDKEGKLIDWAEKLSTWKSPSQSNVKLLLTASRFPCNVVCADGRKIFGYLYISPKGRQIKLDANARVDVAYNLVNKIGLFLPNNDKGYLSSETNISNTSSSYTQSRYVFYETSGIWKTVYRLNKKTYDITEDKSKYHVRPVKR